MGQLLESLEKTALKQN